MKRIISFGMAASVVLLAFVNAKKADGPATYTINGTLKGIPSGKIYLMQGSFTDRTSKAIDSAMISNGKFQLKGKLASAQNMSLKVEPGNWSIGLFVEDGTVDIKADTAGSKHYDYTAYGMGKFAVVNNIQETGSPNYDDIKAYEDNPGQKQFDPAFAELNKKFKAVQGKDIDAEYRVRDQMDSVGRKLKAWQFKTISAYVDKKPSAVAGASMYYSLFRASSDVPYAELDGMLKKFTGAAKASPYYDSLNESRKMLAAVQPGAVAPDFTLLKRDSSKFTLSSMRGKYVMIDFWASWCHPCRQAIPHWKSVYTKYHDKGFDILSVSDDSQWKLWKAAMDVEKMPWNQVCDEFPVKNMPAKVGSLYMTHYIPFYVLLDKEGKILVYSGDEAKIDKKLEEIFEKKS